VPLLDAPFPANRSFNAVRPCRVEALAVHRAHRFVRVSVVPCTRRGKLLPERGRSVSVPPFRLRAPPGPAAVRAVQLDVPVSATFRA
jgi:hypothetical protein